MAVLLAPALAMGLALAGCGTPGAPQQPSLQLPARVTDLAATRAGDQVFLAWTMPKRTTDKVNLRAPIVVSICRQQAHGACLPLAAEPYFSPGAAATFTDTLPVQLAAGAPQPLTYFVELRNHRGRSAGLSNAAAVLAGQAPPAVTGLRATPHKDGIALAWTAVATEPAGTLVRLHRHLLTPSAAKGKKVNLLEPEPEPADRSLLVNDPAQAGRALDRTARPSQSYEYRAQRVARVPVEGKTLELAGQLSEPIRVVAEDIFPPAAPTGLDAVASMGADSSTAAIDLNWQPNTEVELAGYAVYRVEEGFAWQRVSPAEPQFAPSFRDTKVQPGHSYRYAVTAIGRNGHESVRSAEADETVPQP
jgi:hypothetical protein